MDNELTKIKKFIELTGETENEILCAMLEGYSKFAALAAAYNNAEEFKKTIWAETCLLKMLREEEAQNNDQGVCIQER